MRCKGRAPAAGWHATRQTGAPLSYPLYPQIKTALHCHWWGAVRNEWRLALGFFYAEAGGFKMAPVNFNANKLDPRLHARNASAAATHKWIKRALGANLVYQVGHEPNRLLT